MTEAAPPREANLRGNNGPDCWLFSDNGKLVLEE